MQRKSPPLVTLRVQLMKADVREFEDALEERPRTEYRLVKELDFDGRLYIAEPSGRIPEWFEFVQAGIDQDLPDLATRSTAAVLLIRCQERVFAYTFGYGRHHIRSVAVEPDFGLITTLNALEPTSIRSVDLMNFEGQTVHTRTQASRSSAIEVFGLDVERDILRAVTGIPRAGTGFESIAGNEATLKFSARIRFRDLGRVSAHLLAMYQSTQYRDHFDWVDNVKRVRDPQHIGELNNHLLEDLRCENPFAYLAPPEPVDWSEIAGFTFSRGGSELQGNLDLGYYLHKVGSDQLSIDLLKRHRVAAYDSSGNERRYVWPLYNCIVFETTYEKHRFVLSSGEWFEVDSSFAESIHNRIKLLPVYPNPLPKIQRLQDGRLETETMYNQRVASQDRRVALLDGALARCRGTSSGIEPCDLLTEDGVMIHLKRRDSSAKLSHLFAQARISAEALMEDSGFRQECRRKIAERKPGFEEIIPLDQPDPSRFHIVLGFLGIDNDTLRSPSGLPFFSQLNLVRSIQAIRARGFVVSVCGVDIAEATNEANDYQSETKTSSLISV